MLIVMTTGKCSSHFPSEVLTIITFEHYRNPQIVVSENSGLRNVQHQFFHLLHNSAEKKLRKHHRKGKERFYNPGYQNIEYDVASRVCMT